MGPRAGQKVFSLQTVPARDQEPREGVAQYAGFSLHTGIGVEANQREKLERVTRYVSRPPVVVVIASIEEPQLIERILAHRRERGEGRRRRLRVQNSYPRCAPQTSSIAQPRAASTATIQLFAQLPASVTNGSFTKPVFGERRPRSVPATAVHRTGIDIETTVASRRCSSATVYRARDTVDVSSFWR